MRAVGVVIPVLAFASVLAFAGAASAQSAGDNGGGAQPAGQGAAGGDNTQVQATLHTEGGHRVYVATSTIEVHGEIQRPYVFNLSGRSSLGYTYLELPVHFVQEIINAVRHAPF